MIENKSTTTVSLYSNPANDKLDFDFVSDTDKEVTVEVFNVMGS